MATFFSLGGANPTITGNYAVELSRVNTGHLADKLLEIGETLISMDKGECPYSADYITAAKVFLAGR